MVLTSYRQPHVSLSLHMKVLTWPQLPSALGERFLYLILDLSALRITPTSRCCPSRQGANVFWISLLFRILHQREDKGSEAGFTRSSEGSLNPRKLAGSLVCLCAPLPCALSQENGGTPAISVILSQTAFQPGFY